MNLLAVLFFLATQQQLSQTIVVTASEIPETIESAPASVTVITKSDIDERAAREALEGAGGDLRVALVMSKTGHSREEAARALRSAGWVVARAVEELRGAD